MHDKGTYLLVRSLGVQKDLRHKRGSKGTGNGIGSKLLEHVREAADLANKAVKLESRPEVKGFYDKHGFSTDTTEPETYIRVKPRRIN